MLTPKFTIIKYTCYSLEAFQTHKRNRKVIITEMDFTTNSIPSVKKVPHMVHCQAISNLNSKSRTEYLSGQWHSNKKIARSYYSKKACFFRS